VNLSAINCPRCATCLSPLLIGGVETDVCESCGGLWLDRLELARFESPANIFGDALVAHLKQFPAALVDHTVRLRCPRHPGVVLLRQNYSATLATQIDICPQCAGVWLDTDELAVIRANGAPSHD
jgi:Zn-finger nucleic acid-binding protein